MVQPYSMRQLSIVLMLPLICKALFLSATAAASAVAWILQGLLAAIAMTIVDS